MLFITNPLSKEGAEDFVAQLRNGSLATELLLSGSVWRRTEKVVLAVEVSAIVGVVTYCEYGDLGDHEILSLYVVPQYRRRGIGFALLESVISHLLREGAEEIGIRVANHKVVDLINSLPQDFRLHLLVVDQSTGASSLELET